MPAPRGHRRSKEKTRHHKKAKKDRKPNKHERNMSRKAASHKKELKGTPVREEGVSRPKKSARKEEEEEEESVDWGSHTSRSHSHPAKQRCHRDANCDSVAGCTISQCRRGIWDQCEQWRNLRPSRYGGGVGLEVRFHAKLVSCCRGRCGLTWRGGGGGESAFPQLRPR